MYAVGREHPNKILARALMDRIHSQDERIVTDAETLQEILHRYHSINRFDQIEPCFEFILNLVDEVFPIDVATVKTAKLILGEVRGLSARDAIHVASMRIHHVYEIASFDADYDYVPGIRRITG